MPRTCHIWILLAIVAPIAAFRVQGQSQFLSVGETEYFLSMGRCEREATSTYAEGGQRYSGYVCERKFLWFTLAKLQFDNGKRTAVME